MTDIKGKNPTLDTLSLDAANSDVDGSAANPATINATATSVGSTDITADPGLTWSVSPEDKGVTVASGVVTIAGNAGDSTTNPLTYTVTATPDGTNVLGDAKTATFTVTRAAAAIESVKLVDDSEEAVTEVEVDGTSADPASFTAKGVDQYDEDITVTSWSVSPSGQGVSIADGTVTVAPTATAGTYTVTGDGKDETFDVTRAAAYPAEVTVSDGVADMEVPGTGAAKNTAATAFTAVVKDQYGDTMTENTDYTLAWSLVDAPEGVSITEEGKVEVTDAAAAVITDTTGKEYVVKATATGVADATKTAENDDSTKVTVKRAASVDTKIEWYVKDGTTAITEDTIGIPSTGAATKDYEARVLDQYGAVSATEPTVTPSTPAHITYSTGTVTVPAGTDDDETLTLTASSGTLTDAVLTITAKQVNVNWQVEVNDEGITYGDPRSDAFTSYGDQDHTGTATANVGGQDTQITGVFSIEDAETTLKVPVSPETTAKATVKFTVDDNPEYGTYAGTSYTKEYDVTVAPKEVTITGLTAQDKDYNGTAYATANNTAASIGGKIDGDDLTVDTSAASAVFADKNAGEDKEVTFDGYALGGADKDNYTLSGQPEKKTATIRPRGVTISGIKATDRDYEAGNTEVELDTTGATVITVISGDDVTVDVSQATANMNDDTAGTNKPVTVSGVALGGADAANYTLTAQPTGITVDIAPTQVTPPTAETGLTWDGTEKTGVVLPDNAPYTLEGNKGTNAGSYNATAALTDKTNTVWSDTSDATDKTIPWTIAKAADKALDDINIKQNATETAISVSVADLTPSDAGEIAATGAYAVSTASVTGSGGTTVSSEAVSDAGEVTATVANGAKDDVITIPVKITAQNYDCTVNVVVTLTDKDVPVITVDKAKLTKNYDGESFDPADFASAAFDSSEVNGTFTIKKDGADADVTNVPDSGAYSLEFAPDDTDTYEAPAPVNITLTVNPLELTIKADDKGVDPDFVYVGDAFPQLTYTVTGMLESETEAEAIKTDPTLSCTVTETTAAGTYPITVNDDGVAGDNYTIKTLTPGTLTVTKVEVASVELDKTALELIVDEEATLTATVKPDNATVKTVTWESSAPDIASVDTNGKVTAKTPGEATITVSSTDDPTKFAECTVTVNPKGPFKVIVENVTGGTVTVSNEAPYAGDTVKVDVTADEGYSLKSVDVTDVPDTDKSVEATDTSATLTFTMPAEDVTVTVTFTMDETPVEAEVEPEVMAPVSEVETDTTGKTTEEATAMNDVAAELQKQNAPEIDNSSVEEQAEAANKEAVDSLTDAKIDEVNNLPALAGKEIDKTGEGGNAAVVITEPVIETKVEGVKMEGGQPVEVKLDISFLIRTFLTSSALYDSTFVPEDGVNAIELAEKEVSMKGVRITLTIPVPNVLRLNPGDSAYVRHGGKQFRRNAESKDGGLVVTLNNYTDGFSEFDVGSASTSAASVGDDTEDTYTTVQDALDNARNGDTINIEPTAPRETVTVNQPMTFTVKNPGNAPVSFIPGDGLQISGPDANGTYVVSRKSTPTPTPTPTPDSGSGGSGGGGGGSGRSVHTGTTTRPGTTTPASDGALTFKDVPSEAYFYLPVQWAVEKNVTGGYDADTFGPYDTCTRAQTVTFLWRAAGEPEPAATENPFTDVDESNYFYKAVLWAVEKGITNGKTATTFDPYATVTRAQVVTFLYRAEQEPDVYASFHFDDVDSSAYFADAVQWAALNGITKGYTENLFGPFDGCTRAQIVTFLYRYNLR